MMQLVPQNIRQILASDTPLIDVRAPVEFRQSAMPAAINLPLMNDDERAAVGTCYKRQGPDAALALGHQLVNGEIRARRLAAWKEACARHPDGYLCCARGGQRSHIVQQWLKEAGVDYPLLVGGYKALRQAAIQLTEELVQRPIVLIGRDFWQRLIDFDVLVEHGVISPEDKNLFHYAETAEEAWDAIKAAYSGDNPSLTARQLKGN